MKLSDFDYQYPEELIATHPLPSRDASRMLVVNRSNKSLIHSNISGLPQVLKKNDLLVINNTRVFPARLVGKKESGGHLEILLLKMASENQRVGARWRCITNQTKASNPGLKIAFDDGLVGIILSRDGNELIIEFNKPELIEKVGLPPLPPYIRAARKIARSQDREIENIPDKKRYQTIYAKESGSSAAPTAGLHFTKGLLDEIRAAGGSIASVTLHVGLDTFSPVRVENIEEHKMHGEEFFVPQETVEAIETAKKEEGRVIAVGTTSVRALESFYSSSTSLNTDLFIYQGYKFRIVDAMLTNFHQPKSTLLMLVSAFAGREFILKAYNEAIRERYRLFSYGDCMLII